MMDDSLYKDIQKRVEAGESEIQIRKAYLNSDYSENVITASLYKAKRNRIPLIKPFPYPVTVGMSLLMNLAIYFFYPKAFLFVLIYSIYYHGIRLIIIRTIGYKRFVDDYYPELGSEFGDHFIPWNKERIFLLKMDITVIALQLISVILYMIFWI